MAGPDHAPRRWRGAVASIPERAGTAALGSMQTNGDNTAMTTPTNLPCPCGRSATYAHCCAPLHQGQTVATDAETLMRSRYSAYVLHEDAYLRQTWHPSTCPAELSTADAPGQRTQWLGLQVQQHTVTGAETAQVRFVARYRIGGGSAVRMTEHSRFVREDGRWYYLDAAG